MSLLSAKIKNILSDNNNRQSLLLLGANMLSLPVGMIASILSARYLGVSDYGNYAFVCSIYGFATIIFNFGFFQAANRAIVLTEECWKRRQYYGSSLLCTLFLFLLMSIALLLYACFDSNLAEKNLAKFFVFTIPCGIVFMLVKYFEVLLQADNRIKTLAAVNFFPKLLILLFCVWFCFGDPVDSAYKLSLYWWSHIVAQAVVFVMAFCFIKPSYGNLFSRIKELCKYNRSFGFQLYLGSMFALGANAISPVLVGYFCENTSYVALYSLAVMFATPLSIIPNTIATSHYRHFASCAKIPWKLTVATIAVSLLALALLWLLLPWVVTIFYGKEFQEVITLNKPVSIGLLLYGLADYYNRFLGAHGRGKALRNCAVITALLLLISNLILIPRYNAYGAAYGTLIAGFSYLSFIIYYYLIFIRKNSAAGEMKCE